VCALAPVLVEIAAYRIYVASATPGMLLVAALLVTCGAYLVFAHRAAFRLMAA
jgi:hypothetical protein